MVNSKKSSKSILALVVLAILLVASIVLAATGAWFTSKVNPLTNSPVTFGTIQISATNGSAKASVSDPEGTTDLMPGDKLQVSFDFKNEGAKAYVLVNVAVSGAGATTEISAVNGWYTIDVTNKKLVKVIDNKAVAIDTTTGEAITITSESAEIPDTTTNALQGEAVSVSVTVYAIQVDNLTDAEAYTAITTNAASDIYWKTKAELTTNAD